MVQTLEKHKTKEQRFHSQSSLIEFLSKKLGNELSIENKAELQKLGCRVVSDLQYLSLKEELHSFNSLQLKKIQLLSCYTKKYSNYDLSLEEMKKFLEKKNKQVVALGGDIKIPSIYLKVETAKHSSSSDSSSSTSKKSSLLRLLFLFLFLYSVFVCWSNQYYMKMRASLADLSVGTTVNKQEFVSQQSKPRRRKRKRQRKKIQRRGRSSTQKLGFIHIGKTGGTTASKLIRNSCFRRSQPDCDKYLAEQSEKNHKQKKIPHETQISKQVEQYFHIRPVNLDLDGYIVAVRHPVQRMISWYNHFHPLNKLVWFRRRPFFNCWFSLSNLTQVGLRDVSSSKLISTKEEQNCTNYAIDCMQGRHELKECEHMYYNYHFYTSKLLRSRPDVPIYILRTEYFWHDWQRINVMLGGPERIHEIKHVTHLKKKRQFKVNETKLTKEGMRNVCRVLCDEILIYRELITKGSNLNKTDISLSLKELERDCPREAVIDNC